MSEHGVTENPNILEAHVVRGTGVIAHRILVATPDVVVLSAEEYKKLRTAYDATPVAKLRLQVQCLLGTGGRLSNIAYQLAQGGKGVQLGEFECAAMDQVRREWDALVQTVRREAT